MTLLLLSFFCFSDVTRDKSCNAVTQAHMQAYHVNEYTDYYKKQAEFYFGKQLVYGVSTVGYMAYKREIRYAVGDKVKYGLALTSNSKSVSIGFGW